MGLGSTPHGSEAPPPRFSSIEDASQIGERTGSAEEDTISLNLEDNH